MDAEPPWRDSRFPASVEAVRKACGVPAHDHEDDVMIGMMLDRFGWDHAKVEDAYAYSRRRREDLGLAQIKRRILVDGLALQQFPCLLYTSPSPRDRTRSRMPSSA